MQLMKAEIYKLKTIYIQCTVVHFKLSTIVSDQYIFTDESAAQVFADANE